MKRALVLCGGGSKGAYEVGFINALNELNISFDFVFGTSIGALNGCLVATKQYDMLNDLWNELSLNHIIDIDLDNDFKFDLDSIMDNKTMVLSFFKSYIKEKGADITPLKQLIRQLLDEELLLSSPIDFGLCTVLYPSLKPLYIKKSEMNKEDIIDYLIASASCFPIFPIHTFNDQSYIDGGYYDNLPIYMAIQEGADEIIAVDLKEEVTHKHYLNYPHIIYNIPKHDLGKFLDFSEERIKRNKRLGYYDCMKLFHVYSGVYYTFEKYNSSLIMDYYKDLLMFESQLRLMVIHDHRIDFSKFFIESKRGQSLFIEDYFYLTIDYFMELLLKDGSYLYQLEDILEEIKDEFSLYINLSEKIRYKVLDDMISSIKAMGKKEYIGKLLQDMISNEGNIEVTLFSSLFIKELIMARFLYFIYTK